MATAPHPSQGPSWGRRVAPPTSIGAAMVLIQGEPIPSVVPQGESPLDVERADGHRLMPALADTHVHVNEPERTEWEGWHTAASAGVTTLFDLPRQRDPATTTPAALEQKPSAMACQLRIGRGPWDGVVSENPCAPGPMVHRGIRGFLCFLCPSGIGACPHIGPRVGTPTDRIVWEPELSFEVDRRRLVHRSTTTPDPGQTLTDRVYDTRMRDQRIVHDGPLAPGCQGRPLLPES